MTRCPNLSELLKDSTIIKDAIDFCWIIHKRCKRHLKDSMGFSPIRLKRCKRHLKDAMGLFPILLKRCKRHLKDAIGLFRILPKRCERYLTDPPLWFGMYQSRKMGSLNKDPFYCIWSKSCVFKTVCINLEPSKVILVAWTSVWKKAIWWKMAIFGGITLV